MSEVIPLEKSLINTHDFGSFVSSERSAGKSYVQIARQLNKEHQSSLNGVLVTPKMVGDWCRNHLASEKPSTKSNEIINTYNEQKNLLEMVESQIEMMHLFIDDIQCQQASGNVDADLSYKRMKDLMVDQEKYIARKQSILQDMQKLAEKIFNFQSMNAIITEILAIIERKDPELLKEVREEMKNNRILLEKYAEIRQN